jgi:serine/threonine protein kinase
LEIQEYFIDENNIFIITEILSGGELFDFIVEKGCIDEAVASEITI